MSAKTSSNAPNTRSEALKQGKLSFSAAKRSASGSTVGKPKKPVVTALRKVKQSQKDDDDDDDDLDDIEFIPSEEEVEDPIQEVRAKDDKKTATAPTTKSSGKVSTKKLSQEKKPTVEPVNTGLLRVSHTRPEDKKAVADTVEKVSERPELNDKDPKWRKHYREVKIKMGHQPAIHAENQTKIHEILRVFDLTYSYGPCVGVSRLERWERAQMLGLNPPKEVYEILNTKQGATMPEYSESVFHEEV
ncbi:DNA polymerase delta, subunit 4-domain-containing protein [Crassisporium funariophilum]|nr:DNA polymerase delta, subunit 4-domain-containing protein [Crassisporium funariophilum]